MKKSNAAHKIDRARTALIMSQPFWGTLSLYLEPIEDSEIAQGTMATDGKRLVWCPDFVDALSAKELEGVVAHEVSHCALKHPLRRGKRDPELWNVACDYVINRDLIKAGFTLPKGVLLDAKYNGMSEDEIYARLRDEQKQQSQSGQGQPGQQGNQNGQGQPSQPQGGPQGQQPGQGQGGQPQPGQGNSQGQGGSQLQGPGGGAGTNPQPGQGSGSGQAQPGTGKPDKSQLGKHCGRVLDGAPSHSPAMAGELSAEWDRRVSQAVAVAKGHNAGTVPGGLEEIVKARKTASVDWREELRRFIDARNRTDYTWTRPNKRLLGQGFILPGIEPDGLSKLGVIVDTSSSIDTELLTQFVSELSYAMEDGAAEEIVIVHCDTKVQEVERFQSGDTLEVHPVGRGGTRFGPALEWFAKNEPDVAALIYLTDLDSADFGRDPGCPLLWAAYGLKSDLDRLVPHVPFGEVLRVGREGLR